VVTDRPGSYRHDFNKARVGTSVRKSRLDPGLALRILRKFGNALSAPNEAEGSGNDGTTYRFVVEDLGCKEAWSPKPASRSGQLVELAELLVAHAKRSSPKRVRLSEEKMLRLLSDER